MKAMQLNKKEVQQLDLQMFPQFLRGNCNPQQTENPNDISQMY